MLLLGLMSSHPYCPLFPVALLIIFERVFADVITVLVAVSRGDGVRVVNINLLATITTTRRSQGGGGAILESAAEQRQTPLVGCSSGHSLFLDLLCNPTAMY